MSGRTTGRILLRDLTVRTAALPGLRRTLRPLLAARAHSVVPESAGGEQRR